MASADAARASETTEQQKYEHEIVQQHYPREKVQKDRQILAGQFAHDETKKGVKGKLKGFWNKRIVPAFPEAIGDISLIKAALRVESAITKDIKDEKRYPEVAKVAEVRKGLDLCLDELNYLADRKARVRVAFCKYLDLDLDSVHPDDVPIVAFGGSGGGYRAMIGVLGYTEEMKKTGLWDLLTYVSGVSGSCWSLAAYYTWGDTSVQKVVDHCKRRLNPHHPLSPEAIRELLHSPGGAAKTLGPLIQKQYSGLQTVAMDLYSVFTTGYLFLIQDPAEKPDRVGKGPRKEVAGYHQSWLKWTSAIPHLQGGKEPLPILTAIRHERPWKDWVDDTHPFKEADVGGTEHAEAQDAWFQWFEMTPYEIGCDELQAWVPTWGFGRPFDRGKSTMQLPEQSLALLLGLCTSAPAGPLTSYLATIKRNLPAGFMGNSILDLSRGVAKFWGKQGTEEFQQHHPLHACNEHNYMFHLSKGGDKPSPPIENSPRIHLIDSGMDNNCPTYVLLHPKREVDVILNMDASSDVQKDSFGQRVEQIGSRKCLKFVKRNPALKAGINPKDPNRFKGLYGQIYDGSVLHERPKKVIDSYGHEVKNPPAPPCSHECTMVYLPLLPNEAAVPGFDPSTAKFSGSYNLVWTDEQVDMLIKVCLANSKASEGAIKTALMDAYNKKKARREGMDSQPPQTQQTILQGASQLVNGYPNYPQPGQNPATPYFPPPPRSPA